MKQLAIDIVEGKVFGSWMVKNEHDLGMVFMPLMFGSLEENGLTDVAALYEYYDKAGPRSVNGMPCFMSMRYLSKAQVEELQVEINAYATLKESFLKKE